MWDRRDNQGEQAASLQGCCWETIQLLSYYTESHHLAKRAWDMWAPVLRFIYNWKPKTTYYYSHKMCGQITKSSLFRVSGCVRSVKTSYEVSLKVFEFRTENWIHKWYYDWVLGMVVYVYNPSTGSLRGKIVSLRPAWAKVGLSK